MAEQERKGKPKARIFVIWVTMGALAAAGVVAVQRGDLSPSLAAGVLIGTIAMTAVLAVAVVVIVSSDRLTRNLLSLLATILGRKPYYPVSKPWNGRGRRRRSLTRRLPGSRGRGDGWAL
jgi:hypothetical protein